MSEFLRSATGDLVLPRIIVTDPAACAVQQINQGLALWAGSWFLDTSAGFIWLSFLGQKIVSVNQFVSALQAFLLGIPGVTSIIQTVVVFDRVARNFTYKYAVTFDQNVVITGDNQTPASVQGGS